MTIDFGISSYRRARLFTLFDKVFRARPRMVGSSRHVRKSLRCTSHCDSPVVLHFPTAFCSNSSAFRFSTLFIRCRSSIQRLAARRSYRAMVCHMPNQHAHESIRPDTCHAKPGRCVLNCLRLRVSGRPCRTTTPVTQPCRSRHR